MADVAAAAIVCLTLAQARIKYPDTHLWWHYGTKNEQCWSDKRGPVRTQRVAPAAPPGPADGNGSSAARAPVPGPVVSFPALMPSSPDKIDPSWLIPGTMERSVDVYANTQSEFSTWDQRITGAFTH